MPTKFLAAWERLAGDELAEEKWSNLDASSASGWNSTGGGRS